MPNIVLVSKSSSTKVQFGIKLEQSKIAEQELEFLFSKIDAGVKAAIERHRKLGEPISIMQDGKVITLTAKGDPNDSEPTKA